MGRGCAEMSRTKRDFLGIVFRRILFWAAFESDLGPYPIQNNAGSVAVLPAFSFLALAPSGNSRAWEALQSA
ncbi:hypothetical protein BN3661_01212 [Eubacteriaceae bacterium CHKCI005]|nr:hypothetical protein BN3661_01212 [Eubacteriaceae bacterium CHKCI005]